jgi:hypothetical protein
MDDAALREVASCADTVTITPPPPMAKSCGARAAGELAMLRAMLLDAIQCLERQGCPKRARERLAVQARAWVVRRNDDSPFSFENVCAYLGLPADRLRRILVRMAAASARRRDDAGSLRRRASAAEIRARAGRNLTIRSLRESGMRPSDLAERFGLSYESILSICTRHDPAAPSAPHTAA